MRGRRGQQAEAFWIAPREQREELLRLYAAGNGKAQESDLRDYETGLRRRLLSYAFLSDWAKEAFRFWVENGRDDVHVLLDSGAFSAKTLGTKIEIEAYCNYVEQHREVLAAYFVLDVIGDAEASQRNYEYMRRRGLDPLPVYHVSVEPLSVLEGILAQRPGYVALGGMASERATRAELRLNLDACWRVIERFWPVKVHGLGVMAQWALERYPFYSVDGSSAIVAAGMGRVARWNNGQLLSRSWTEDVAATWDGVVADGVGRTGGKSDSAHSGRRRRNIEAQLALEQYVTELWAARGVAWDEQEKTQEAA